MAYPYPMHRVPRRPQIRPLRQLNIREEQGAQATRDRAAETNQASSNEEQMPLPKDEDVEMADVDIPQTDPIGPESSIDIWRSHHISNDPKATNEQVLQRARVQVEYRIVWNRDVASDVLYTTGEKIRTAKIAFRTMQLGFSGKYPRVKELTGDLSTNQALFHKSILFCQQMQPKDTRRWIQMIPTKPGTYNNWYNTHIKSGLNDYKTLRIEVHIDNWVQAEKLQEDGSLAPEERPCAPPWDAKYQSLEDQYAGCPIYDEETGQMSGEVEEEAEFEYYMSTLEFFKKNRAQLALPFRPAA